ncbi:AbrB/MazE/SpoVT family DNA-binding domain-containing protein [Thiolapillus sp.]
MATATISSKSQLVLPAEIRRKLGIRPGDRLVIELEGDHAILRKAPASDMETLAEFRSNHWKGYSNELDTMRKEWDS